MSTRPGLFRSTRIPARLARAATTFIAITTCGSLLWACAARGRPPTPEAGTGGPTAASASAVSSSSSSGAGPVGQPTPSLSVPAQFRDPLPGMPPVIKSDIYAATRAGMLSRRVAGDPALLYVPDSAGSTVTVISQRTHKIIRRLKAGQLSQHVSPSYDLRWLYADSSAANELVIVDPHTARVRGRVSVPRPYNLYFTPDGRQAVLMVEQRNRITFADARTFRRLDERKIRGCRGPNHADFSANGRYFVVTCEFSGAVVKVSTQTHRTLATLKFGGASMPQDVRVSPDGRIFYVADMGADRVRLIAGDRFRQIKTVRTPKQPHGLYPSRDGKLLYVSDRGAGKVSVISFASNKIVGTWTIPGGGSPDMGGVSADGRVLWLSGRYHGVVYGFDTRTGRLIAKIRVGGNPHGLAVWPQPGRYSLGHTGNMR
jgi:DNA-binding beta-propeller fold protein YncE